MDFAGVITAVGAAAAVAAFSAQVEAVRRWQERTRRTLQEAREPTVENALKQGDLKGLGAFFFETLGQLPLADYAEDAEARKLVSQAVRNVENFVDPDRISASEEVSTLAREDAQRIEFDIARGDFWGGLTRLRRRIELLPPRGRAEGRNGGGADGSRTIAAAADPRGDSAGRGRPRSLSSPFRSAIAVSTAGPVSGEEVEQALVLAAQGLDAIDIT